MIDYGLKDKVVLISFPSLTKNVKPTARVLLTKLSIIARQMPTSAPTWNFLSDELAK